MILRPGRGAMTSPRTPRRARAIAVAATALVVATACGGRSASSSSGQTAATLAPPPPGSGINADDESYCAANRQREQRCHQGASPYGQYTEQDHRRCLEDACELRSLHGRDLAHAINTCFLQRPCGQVNKDACFTMVLGAHAQSPRAQQTLARCRPFEQRCGPLSTGHDKTAGCAFVALLGDELTSALSSCFDLECGLAQECLAGNFMRALVPCDLRDR